MPGSANHSSLGLLRCLSHTPSDGSSVPFWWQSAVCPKVCSGFPAAGQSPRISRMWLPVSIHCRHPQCMRLELTCPLTVCLPSFACKDELQKKIPLRSCTTKISLFFFQRGRGAPSQQSELRSLSGMQNTGLCIRSEIFRQRSLRSSFYSRAGLISRRREQGREA